VLSPRPGVVGKMRACVDAGCGCDNWCSYLMHRPYWTGSVAGVGRTHQLDRNVGRCELLRHIVLSY